MKCRTCDNKKIPGRGHLYCAECREARFRQRFWQKVDSHGGPDACWTWLAHRDLDGYGHFGVGRQVVLAHRYAWELTHGAQSESLLDHRCHNTSCVNPAHLRPATSKQNSEHRRGPNRGNSSGVRGVSRNPYRVDSWIARVCHNSRQIHLGTFNSIADAEAAVLAKRLELFTHNDIDKEADQ